MNYNKYKIGDVVDVDFDRRAVQNLLLNLVEEDDYEDLGNGRVMIKEFGEVVDTFGIVNRVKQFRNNKKNLIDREIDVKSNFMRLNKKHHREKRLKNLLD